MRSYTLKPLVFALLLLPLMAQAATPGAGEILQQIRPSVAPAPSSTGTGLEIQKERGEKLPPSAPFLVKRIEIRGNTLFDTPTLHALLVDAEGSEITLSQLEEFAARITGYYRSHGHPLARAIVPAQTIKDGVVIIEVIEAKYGKIKLDNRSRVGDFLLEKILSSLQGGTPIEQNGMDHALLLLSDIPGVAVDATLKPGEAVGTSDLSIVTDPTAFVFGNVAFDNYGDRYTGRTRAGGAVNINDPLHHGDLLSISGLTSGSGMNYARVGYDTLLDGAGTRIGAAYSALHYILGSTLANLNGHGTADVGSVWAKHPLIRSRDLNLSGQFQYDHLNLADHIDTTGIMTDRHLDNLTGTLSGDDRNASGVDTWSLALSSGHVGFDNTAAAAADAATTKTVNGFSKWNLNFSRIQNLNEKNVLYIALAGQWANANLDPSQQMVAGGPYTVRAYDMGVVSGDEGYLGTIELRHSLNDQWQAVAFWDSEHVTVNKITWVAGANSATLSGAGVGLDWSNNGWNAKAYVAARTNPSPVLVSAASSTRAWVQLSRGF